jgi:hypothetical protein
LKIEAVCRKTALSLLFFLASGMLSGLAATLGCGAKLFFPHRVTPLEEGVKIIEQRLSLYSF